MIVLSDGSYIMEYQFFYKSNSNDNSRYIVFLLDTNGAKGPNAQGRDVFEFRSCMNENPDRVEFEDWRRVEQGGSDRIIRECRGFNGGIETARACGAYLKLNNWKMDY